jgi:hypothetical protein
VLTAVLTDSLIHHCLPATKEKIPPQIQSQQRYHHIHMATVVGHATVSGVALMVGVLVTVGMQQGEFKEAFTGAIRGVLKRLAWPAAKGAFLGAFFYVCEQCVKSVR